jgi:hypothetical protein
LTVGGRVLGFTAPRAISKAIHWGP